MYAYVAAEAGGVEEGTEWLVLRRIAYMIWRSSTLAIAHKTYINIGQTP